MTCADRFHAPLRIDLFCRVVDNLGDAAVSWRLARQLATEHAVAPRLWIDTPAALARLVPGARPGDRVDGVRIEHWNASDPRLCAADETEVADAVIVTFGCVPPDGYRTAMRTRRPVWVDVDHLSAQAWVDGVHGLPSPKPDGLVEHFWFPGPSPRAGGLLREADLLARRDAFDADPGARTAFLAALGVEVSPGDRFASMFCYPDSPLDAVCDALAADRGSGRWRLLLPDGVGPPRFEHPVVQRVPFVSQRDYDRLLWCCALNWVRGEDSVVRALWAARPFVWQAYRQPQRGHDDKVCAWLDGWLDAGAVDRRDASALAALHEAWNRAPEPDASHRTAASLPAMLSVLPALQAAARRACARLAAAPSLAERLMAFIISRL